MDWPTASVLIAAILSALAAYLASLWAADETTTEAIGFHVDHIGGRDDTDED